jgi:hypothetical protein
MRDLDNFIEMGFKIVCAVTGEPFQGMETPRKCSSASENPSKLQLMGMHHIVGGKCCRHDEEVCLGGHQRENFG